MIRRPLRFLFRTSPQAAPRLHQNLILGATNTPKGLQPVILPEALRPTHLAVIGFTGVGKSYFLENLIRQDIMQGTGFVLFDVHGDLADNVVAYLAANIPRHDRQLLARVVLIEPFDPIATFGFNPLQKNPHTSPHVQAQELAHVLRSRWEATNFGPRTEELLRNTLYTLSVNDLTLLELPLLLTDRTFREKLLNTVDDVSIREYWNGRYGTLSDAMQHAVREPLLTRVSAFLANPRIRDILGQQQSTFSFSRAMKEGLWVIVNLSKGKLGEEASHVLGSLLFTKLELDTMAQANIPEMDRRLFAVYADELQNLIGQNVATLIAEARKYHISITTGQQYWGQLSPHMRLAVLGMGSRVFFRLTYHDAVELAGELHPSRRHVAELTTLSRGQAFFRAGSSAPVRLTVLPHEPPACTSDDITFLRAQSHLLHAKFRSDVRKEAERRTHKDPDQPQTSEPSPLEKRSYETLSKLQKNIT